MKIMIYSDVHWAFASSIIRKYTNKYTQKLDGLINSMNWVNNKATELQCDFMICAGDFFDKPKLSDIEITALKEIKWNNLPCYFLCGNHESSVIDLRYSALKLFESDSHHTIDKVYSLTLDTCQIHFIPYITESERESIEHYINNIDNNKKQIIISHNDIRGIRYGGFESKAGFSIEEIEKYADIYLNGHLHNSEWITKKILNLGSLSAHNFTNDSDKYSYGAWILDTDTLECVFVENPYAFNFYKLVVETDADIDKMSQLKDNSVLYISYNPNLYTKLCEKLDQLKDKIIDNRLIPINSKLSIIAEEDITDLQVNHLQKLGEFCTMKFGADPVILAELQEICA